MTRILLNVLPSGIDTSKLISAKGIGTVESTDTQINVNAVPVGFSVVYRSDVLNRICTNDTTQFMNSLMSLFEENVTNSDFDIALLYHYETEDGYEFDKQTAINICNLEMKILEMSKMHTKFKYSKTKSIIEVVDTLQDIMKETKETNDKLISDDDIKESISQVREMNSFLIGPYDFKDDDEKDKNKKKKRNKSKSEIDSIIRSSRSLKSSDNPKKEYKRHGVIVARQSAMKKDEKEIKKFLKGFIPGKQDWKKKFRNDVAERWINVYAISNRDLKTMQKRQNRATKTIQYRQRTEDLIKALEITNKMINIPIDRWNDPRR